MPGPSVSESDQHRLHAWPDWDASIQQTRTRLAFDPTWTPAPGKPQSAEYVRWRESVELRRLLVEARRALIQLQLSGRFTDYWIACFLAPYERDGFSVILDPEPSGDISTKRAFPPPTAFWFEAGIDASTAPATLVIEGPAALASSALLRAAERRSLEAKRRAGFTKQHPLTHSRQIGPALEDRALARAQPDEARTTSRSVATCVRGSNAAARDGRARRP